MLFIWLYPFRDGKNMVGQLFLKLMDQSEPGNPPLMPPLTKGVAPNGTDSSLKTRVFL